MKDSDKANLARQNSQRPALRAGCRRGRRRTQFLPRTLLGLPDLKRLPRAKASPDFTAEVLRRVRSDETRSAAPRLGFAVACLAVVVASAAAGAWWARQSAPEPAPITAESLEQFKSEHRELLRELESLRRLAHDSQPFVPVSIDPQTEVLFDLRDIEPLPIRYAATSNRRVR